MRAVFLSAVILQLAAVPASAMGYGMTLPRLAYPEPAAPSECPQSPSDPACRDDCSSG